MNPATAEKEAQHVDVVMPLTEAQFATFSEDLERLAETLNLPSWASNTELIVEAVHRQAGEK